MTAAFGQLRELWMDPFRVAPELEILRVPQGKGQGRPRIDTLRPLYEEQAQVLETMRQYRQTLILKSRRMGISTIVAAILFADVYNPMINAPRRVQNICHHEDWLKVGRRMIQGFHAGLPVGMQTNMRPDNLYVTGFEHNDSAFFRGTAGGGGQGRGDGVTHLWCTEMGLWPTGSAARGNSDTSQDQDTWMSMMAAMDDPEGRIVVESTGNGPRGLFHELYEVARDSEQWGFLFFPWTDFSRYSTPFGSEEAKRRFEESLSEEERQLRAEYSLALEQLRWRRDKFEVEKYEIKRFRREYPLTDADPFLLDESGWFDQESLNALLRTAQSLGGKSTPEQLIMYERPEAGRTYFMGVDTSGGVGEDEFTAHVFREDMAQCCVYRNNRLSPARQGEWVSKIGSWYDNPLTIVEINKYGQEVLDRAIEIGGITPWKNPDGKSWFTHRKNKMAACTWARDLCNQQMPLMRHPETIRQLMKMVDKGGNVQAATGHDDLAVGAILALFAGRNHFRMSHRVMDERSALRAAAEQMYEFRQDPMGLRRRVA